MDLKNNVQMDWNNRFSRIGFITGLLSSGKFRVVYPSCHFVLGWFFRKKYEVCVEDLRDGQQYIFTITDAKKVETKVKIFVHKMSYLNQIESPLVTEKDDGGFIITDFPLNVESPNASLHIDKDGNITSGHNIEEVERIIEQLNK